MADKTYYMFDEAVPMMFPDLFDPKPLKLDNGSAAAPKFSAQFLLDPATATFKRVKELILSTAEEAFGNKKLCRMPLFDDEAEDNELKLHQNPGRSHCLLEGERIIERAMARAIKNQREFDEKKLAHLKGKFVLVAKSGVDYPPRLAAIVNDQPVEFNAGNRTTAQAYFYPGVRVVPGVSISSYAIKGGGSGINAYLQSVFSTGEGERMGGGQSAVPSNWKEKFGLKEDDFTGSAPAKKPIDFGKLGRKVPEMLDDEIPF